MPSISTKHETLNTSRTTPRTSISTKERASPLKLNLWVRKPRIQTWKDELTHRSGGRRALDCCFEQTTKIYDETLTSREPDIPSIVAFYNRYKFLPETTSFTFPFKQTLLKRAQKGNFCEYTIATIYQANQTNAMIKTYQNISLSDGSLDVSDN